LTRDEERWTVRLADTAETDFRNIVEWTLEQFGEKQAVVYADTVIAALEALSDGPTTIGVKERVDIAKGLFTLHVARGRRRGRHFVLFRVTERRRARTIEVLRLLHDSMDLDRHVPRTDVSITPDSGRATRQLWTASTTPRSRKLSGIC
jgi:toxin ParE1/3/4